MEGTEGDRGRLKLEYESRTVGYRFSQLHSFEETRRGSKSLESSCQPIL